MINVPLTREYARNGKTVYLQRDLPLGFGNRNPIYPNLYNPGRIESDGFKEGVVKVVFGSEHTEFNPDAALRYLECDPWRV